MNKLNDLLRYTCEYFDISIEDIKGKVRTATLARSRRFYCKIARNYTECTIKEISQSINRHHSSIIYSVKKMDYYVYNYEAIKNEYERFLNFIRKKLEKLNTKITKKGIIKNYFKAISDSPFYKLKNESKNIELMIKEMKRL